MSTIRQKGDKSRYDVSGPRCIGCKCLALGQYQHRGAVMGGGSRNTGDYSACCLNRAYRGCPDEDNRGYSPQLAAERKREGMRIIR